MSDFVQVLKDWHRMCNGYFDGENWVCNKTCPMYSFEVCSKPTAKYPVPLDIGQDLACKINCAITVWSAENPEPVYPSWYEYLTDMYLATWNMIKDKPIPNDIAEKLGLKPKEAR